jgi:predicted peroxiredoxin
VDTKSAVSLSTGLEDAERVTVAFLVAVGSAESGRPTLMVLTKEAVRLAHIGFARATACEGCPPLEGLVRRYADAGGRYLVCPTCFDARHLAREGLQDNVTLGGTVPMWEWMGDQAANTCSY